MMCVLDQDQRVLYANSAFTAFTGISAEDLKGGRACGMFGCSNAGDDPRGCGCGPSCPACALRQALADTIKTGVGHSHVEHRSTWVRNGERREAVLVGSTALIQAEQQTFLLLCLHDITTRKRAEEALRDSEEKFAKVFHGAPVWITVTDLATGMYVDVNETLLRVSGCTREEVIGHTASELGWIPAEARERLVHELRDHGRIVGLEMTFRTKDGRILQGLVDGERHRPSRRAG